MRNFINKFNNNIGKDMLITFYLSIKGFLLYIKINKYLVCVVNCRISLPLLHIPISS